MLGQMYRKKEKQKERTKNRRKERKTEKMYRENDSVTFHVSYMSNRPNKDSSCRR